MFQNDLSFAWFMQILVVGSIMKASTNKRIDIINLPRAGWISYLKLIFIHVVATYYNIMT